MSSEGGNGQISLVPPGFRFHPTDEELLYYYLRKKVSYEAVDLDVIREVDLNKLEPWDLKEKCRIGSGIENEWYFFSHKDKKYPTGTRTNRATTAGFWKATGRDKAIYLSNSNSNSKKIGMRKTLVFYTGRAPHGLKTDWIMHEYRLDDHIDAYRNSAPHQVQEDGWVVCRVFRKNLCHSVGKDNIITTHEFYQLDRQPLTTQLDGDRELETQALRDGHFPNNNNHYTKLPSTSSPSIFATDPRLQNLLMLHDSTIGMHLPQLWSPESTTVPGVISSMSSTLPITMQIANDHPNNYLLRPMLGTNASASYDNGGSGGDWSFLDKLLQASHPQNLHNEDHVITKFNYPNSSSLANDVATAANVLLIDRSHASVPWAPAQCSKFF